MIRNKFLFVSFLVLFFFKGVQAKIDCDFDRISEQIVAGAENSYFYTINSLVDERFGEGVNIDILPDKRFILWAAENQYWQLISYLISKGVNVDPLWDYSYRLYF